ncbi:MAG: C25 family cysteine peptidase [Pusillimonas sp.]
MKKYLVMFVMVLLCGSVAFADEIRLSDDVNNGLSVVSEKFDGSNLSLKMNCGLRKLDFYDADTPMGPFSVLYSPEFYFGGAYGAPQLPVITKIIQVPFGAECKVVVKSYDTKVYNLADFGVANKIYPRQPSAPKDGSEVPFVYEKSAYIHKGFNGQPLATIEDIGVMRHMRLVQLTVSPITYSAIDNKINVYNNIDFEVVMTGSNMSKTRTRHSAYASDAFAFAESMIIVPEALKFGRNKTKESYVIVSDPMFKKALAPFEDWKKSQGYIVKTVYTDEFGTGSAITEPLKRYLHDLYNNPTAEMPAPSYVLFVGDHAQVPAFRGQTGSHITELYYVAVTPGDFLPDMLTGRFSAQNLEQLMPQIEKTMEYGQKKFADSEFLNRAVLVAGYDSYWARSHGWAHINYAENYYMNNEHGLKNVYKTLSAGSQQNASTIIQKVAEGAVYVNYTAHGSSTSWADPRFLISDIYKLGNKGQYPLVIGNCCLTSKFEVSECFGEAWLRAKDAGAIGYVGGTNSTYWDEDFYWGVGLHSIVKPNNEGVFPLKEKTGPGAFEAMFEGKGVTNAGFMVAGNLAVESSTSSRKQYYWEVYHLMGDPSLKTYIGVNK